MKNKTQLQEQNKRKQTKRKIIYTAKPLPKYLTGNPCQAIRERASNIDEIYDRLSKEVKILDTFNEPSNAAYPPEKIAEALSDRFRDMREQGVIIEDPPSSKETNLRVWLDWMQRIRLVKGEKITGVYTHSPDYRSVVWNGQHFTFTPKRATIIKILWESDTPIHKDKIAAAINTTSEKYRLIDSFRSHGKYDPAWSVMIEHLGGGLYTLRKKPKNQTS